MWNKFRTGQFGAPVRLSGIGTPMDATPGRIGKITYYGPEHYGNTIPEEVAAKQMPIPPSYMDKVVTGDQPPQVVSNGIGNVKSLMKRMFRGGP